MPIIRRPRTPTPDTNSKNWALKLRAQLKAATNSPIPLPRAESTYDNGKHGWAGGPPPKSPPNRDVAAYHDLLEYVRADRSCGVAVFPWVRRATAPSETTAIVMSRLLYWFGPAEPATPAQVEARKRQGAFGRNFHGVEDLRARGMVRVEPDGGGYAVMAVPASDRELASQTLVPPSSVREAVRRLREAGWIEVVTVQGCRYVELLSAAVATAYAEGEGDKTAAGEFDRTDREWFESETAGLCTYIVTWLLPSLYTLTKNHLAARTLHQIIHVCEKTKGDWYHTTLDHLGQSLGVEDDAVDAALKLLVKCGLIHRKTWRGRRGAVRSARFSHTLLAPASAAILAGLPARGRRSA